MLVKAAGVWSGEEGHRLGAGQGFTETLLGSVLLYFQSLGAPESMGGLVKVMGLAQSSYVMNSLTGHAALCIIVWGDT